MTMAEVAHEHDSGEPRVTSIGGNALTAAVPTAGLTGDVRVGARPSVHGSRRCGPATSSHSGGCSGTEYSGPTYWSGWDLALYFF